MSKATRGIPLSVLQERLDKAKVIVDTLVYDGVIDDEHFTYWKNTIIYGTLSNCSITLSSAKRIIKKGCPSERFNPRRAVKNLLLANGYYELSVHKPRGVVYEQFPFTFSATLSEEQVEWFSDKLAPKKRIRPDLIDGIEYYESDDKVIDVIETMILENPVYEDSL